MQKTQESISEITNPPVDDDQDGFEGTENNDKPGFDPWRIFVNQIDSYHGKKFVKFISEQIYDPIESDEEEEGVEKVVDEEVRTAEKRARKTVRKYKVIGTMMDSKAPITGNVLMIIDDPGDRDSFLAELMKCGVIVYDITQDNSQIAEARWALEALTEELKKMASERTKAFQRREEVRHFVLISTVMTWALSKPLYLEHPDLAFTEADYRKRKPHANFKEHIQCEKDVVIVKKCPELRDKLKTLVLCCGVTYGDEEGPFHPLFRMGWENAPELPIFGKGNNKIPVLHVRNIPMIILMFLRDWPKLRYVVAVEYARMSQKTIVKKISKVLTTGRVRSISPEEAFLVDGVDQKCYDLMTLNLNIEPAYLEDRNFEWHSDLPFSENIMDIVKEYKSARNLHPVKIVVLGPPASGKSRLAKALAKYYKIHYVHVKSLIDETVDKLTNAIEAARNSKNILENQAEDDDDDDEDADVNDEEEGNDVESWEKDLVEIRKNLTENQNRLGDTILNKILRKKLLSKECQNQGYVLDGFPKTLHQAKELFGGGENENEYDPDEEDEEVDSGIGFKRNIMPEFVAVLIATDEFLTERLLNLSEKEIQGTHYTEEHMIRRFREYRERNTDDNTVLQFFDELEIHPVLICVEDDPCPDMISSLNICLKKIGRPRNYGPTAEEMEVIQRRAKAESEAAEIAENEKRVVEELNRKNQRERKMMEWTNLLEKLKEEEESQLCIMGEPLRHYLVKYVFPTLTQGLVKVAELRPEDPVDYLAEYLFKENPEGKMFEPDYTETMSMLLAAIEELQRDILPLKELDKGEEKYLKRGREASVKKVANEQI